MVRKISYWYQLSIFILLTICFFGGLRFGVSVITRNFTGYLSKLESVTVTNRTLLSRSNCDNCIQTLITQEIERKKLAPDYLPIDSSIMTAKDMFRYLRWTNSTSCRLAADFGFSLRIAGAQTLPDGHKAVCLDQPIGPVYDQCLVYSFGINNEWSFDDAMANFKCKVFSFDPSMGVSDHNRSEFITFYNIGLADKNMEQRLSAVDGTEKRNEWKMMKATSIYDMLKTFHGESFIDVLKIDIEFSEWTALEEMLYSGFLASRVKQLAVEVHFLGQDTLDVHLRRIALLRKIESPLRSNAEDSHIGGFSRFSSRLPS